VLACGAHDELYLRGLTGGIINENTEIHNLLGAELNQFVNTEAGKFTGTVSEIFPIEESMPIWQFMEKVSLYDKTTRTEIKLSEQGEHPCAIIVPGNIGYPLEKVRITTAYPDFPSWVKNATENRDWYKNYEEKKIFKGLK
jgi:LruC domain-containing protein